jgi:hypothetical protein
MTHPKKLKSNLLFTSAGDANNLSQWLEDERDYDIWVVYYGDKSDVEHSQQVEYFTRRKGGKLQNFHSVYLEYQNLIEEYQSVLLADDDIIISPEDINSLFRIRKDLQLSVLQPSFDPRGKNSYPHSQTKLFSSLRYTNFVEIGFPVFETAFLSEFMQVFSPKVNCWGVDWWYSTLITESKGLYSMAIADSISCVNPPDAAKGKQREIERLISEQALADNWKAFNKENKLNIKPIPPTTLKCETTYEFRLIQKQVRIWLLYQLERLKRKLGFS